MHVLDLRVAPKQPVGSLLHSTGHCGAGSPWQNLQSHMPSNLFRFPGEVSRDQGDAGCHDSTVAFAVCNNTTYACAGSENGAHTSPL